MQLSNLFRNLPPGTPAATADRIVAVACAMRILPDKALTSGASDVTTLARWFEEEWLRGAKGDEHDAWVRRSLLLMVCDKAGESTPKDRIRSMVKELHKHVTRG